MKEIARRTGIDILGDAPWGIHLCQFYRTARDLTEILVPFFRAGLESDEFCMWVTAEPLRVEDARTALRKVVRNLDKYARRGQIEILDSRDWYTASGRFEPGEVLQGWVNKEDEARRRGFDGLRLTGNTFWLEQSDWQCFADYEAEIDRIISDHRMIAICSYSLDKCGASDIIDVVNNHRYALIRRGGEWELLESAKRRDVEAALVDKGKQLELIADNLPAYVAYVDSARRFRFVNRMYGETLGVSNEDAYGKRVEEVLGSERYSMLDQHVTEALSGQRVSFDAGLPFPDAQYRYIHVDMVPHFDEKGAIQGLFVLVNDVTERKEAEDALNKSEERLRLYLEMSPYAIFVSDLMGTFLYVNQALEEITGYSRQELIGKNVLEINLLPREYLPKAAESMERSAAGEPTGPDEYELIREDGGHVFAEVSAIPVGHPGPTEVIGIFQDITERKKIDNLKDEFIGLVSHELRSPLTVVIAALHTCLAEEERLSPEEAHGLVEDALFEAERLSHLLGNLLELSRAQADRLVLDVQSLDLRTVIQGVIEKIRPQHPEHDFRAGVPRDLPPIDGDRLRLERILYNLLDNAAKYSSKGGRVAVSVKPDSRGVVVGVSDHGSGIALEHQAMLFQPFQRLEDSIQAGVKGVGLGLLVCRRLVEAHGGRIWVESEPGRGTTFYLTLPCKAVMT